MILVVILHVTHVEEIAMDYVVVVLTVLEIATNLVLGVLVLVQMRVLVVLNHALTLVTVLVTNNARVVQEIVQAHAQAVLEQIWVQCKNIERRQ